MSGRLRAPAQIDCTETLLSPAQLSLPNSKRDWSVPTLPLRTQPVQQISKLRGQGKKRLPPFARPYISPASLVSLFSQPNHRFYESHRKTLSIHSEYLFRLQIQHQTTSHSICHCTAHISNFRNPFSWLEIHSLNCFSCSSRSTKLCFWACIVTSTLVRQHQHLRPPSLRAHHHQNNPPSPLHTSKPQFTLTVCAYCSHSTQQFQIFSPSTQMYVSWFPPAPCTFQLHFTCPTRLQLRLRLLDALLGAHRQTTRTTRFESSPQAVHKAPLSCWRFSSPKPLAQATQHNGHEYTHHNLQPRFSPTHFYSLHYLSIATGLID